MPTNTGLNVPDGVLAAYKHGSNEAWSTSEGGQVSLQASIF